MLKPLRAIKYYYRLIKALRFILRADMPPETWQSELDYKDLARGRWLRYKEMAAPQYNIGLDKDAEALLEQKFIFDITQFKRRLTGKEEVELTNKMINLCKEAEQSGKQIKELI